MKYYADAIKKYAVFSGREGRKEYWMFVLINFIISLVIGLAESALGWKFTVGIGEIGILSCIYCLFIFIPSLAIMVRRLHDIDKSGWLVLLELIPVVGSIILIVFFCMKGTVGDNRYGAEI